MPLIFLEWTFCLACASKAIVIEEYINLSLHITPTHLSLSENYVRIAENLRISIKKFYLTY